MNHSPFIEHNLGSVIRMLKYQPRSAMKAEGNMLLAILWSIFIAGHGKSKGSAPVTLTAMAATGMPITQTKHCDIREVVKYGSSGLLAKERDVEGLVSHLLWLVENPERWQTMTDRGREHIELHFDAIRQGERMSLHYRNVIDHV